MADKAATSSRIVELTRRLERDPGSRIFLELAREHHSAGNLAEAAKVCRDGLKRNPGYQSARVLLGRTLIDQKLFAEARPELETVVKLSPDNLLARRLLGEALAGSGETQSALEVFQGLVRTNPLDTEAAGRLRELEAAAAPAAPPPQPAPAGVETLKVPLPPEALESVQEAAAEAPAPAAQVLEPSPPDEAGPAPPIEEIGERTTIELETPGFVRPPLRAFIQEPVAEERAPAEEEASPAPAAAETFGPSAPAAGEAEAAREEEHTSAPAVRPLRPRLTQPTIAGPVPEAPAPVEAESVTASTGPPVLADQPEPAMVPAPAPPPEPEASAEPVATAREAAEPAFGAIPTPTLAELYLAQGMTQRALEVYQQVLAGDPHNEEVRDRVDELTRRLSPAGTTVQDKIAALRGWLERIRRAHDAQDHARRGGPTTPGL